MVPKGTDNLLQLAACLTQGLVAHQSWIGLGDDWTQDIRSKVDCLYQAAMAEATARSAESLAKSRLELADKGLKSWLAKARLVVTLARGSQVTESWIHAGFAEPTTRVPKALQARIGLARSLVSFFARHPEFGVPFAEVTAARGRTIYERVIQSCEMLQLAAADCGLTRQERATADLALRETLRQVIAALKLRFDRSDPRWSDFGLVPAVPASRGKCRLRSKAAAPIPFVRHSHRSSQRTAAA